MKDEEYCYVSDVRDKKVVARSARNARTHCGKGGRVKFPSDYLSKKELKAMNGECKSYRLNEPMTWAEFKSMPDDIKVTYIKLLQQKFNVPMSAIGKMLGVCQSVIQRESVRLGIAGGKGKAAKNWDKDGWHRWCLGMSILSAEAEEESATEEVEAEIPAEIVLDEEVPCEPSEEVEPSESVDDGDDAVPAVNDPEPIHHAIPDSGNMTFEGKIDDILNTLSFLLAGAKVHIGIQWDLLDD